MWLGLSWQVCQQIAAMTVPAFIGWGGLEDNGVYQERCTLTPCVPWSEQRRDSTEVHPKHSEICSIQA